MGGGREKEHRRAKASAAKVTLAAAKYIGAKLYFTFFPLIP